MNRTLVILAATASLPFTMGATAPGCGGPLASMAPAPDVTGKWAVRYGDTMEVDVTLGGKAYHQSLGPDGGRFSITHEGQPFSFDIDCSRPEVVCPQEVWPAEVTIDQREAAYPHRMWVTIPTQSCSGALVAPARGTCGAGTANPDCKPVCSGTVTTRSADAFGLIADDGQSFGLLLGAGAASNGVNCAMLGVSGASATLVSTGSPATADWTARSMTGGKIATGYAGGCLWVSDPQSQRPARRARGGRHRRHHPHLQRRPRVVGVVGATGPW